MCSRTDERHFRETARRKRTLSHVTVLQDTRCFACKDLTVNLTGDLDVLPAIDAVTYRVSIPMSTALRESKPLIASAGRFG